MNKLIERFENEFTVLEANEHRRFDYLETAFWEKDVEAIEHYLSKGFCLNPRNARLQTPAYKLRNQDLEFFEYLVSKGLDLHVLNVEGVSLISQLSLVAKEEVFIYLLKQGLNPYEKCFNGANMFAFKEYFRHYITPTFISQHCLYSEDEFTYEKALIEKNFPLALQIIQNKMERMGGLSKVANHIERPSVYKLWKKYYNALVLNKQYEAANNALKFFLSLQQEFNVTEGYFEPFGLTAPLMVEDSSTLIGIGQSNINFTENNAFELAISTAFSAANELLNSDDAFLIEIRKKGRFLLGRGGFERLYSRINTHLFLKKVPFPDDFGSSFQEEIEQFPKEEQLEPFFYMGLVYLKNKDKANAEYSFMRVVNLSYEIGCTNDDLLAHSYGMIDYLNK